MRIPHGLERAELQAVQRRKDFRKAGKLLSLINHQPTKNARMAIIRKEIYREHIEQLKTKYHRLEALVIGTPPSENKAHEYNREIDQFHAEYTDIDQTKINIAVDEFAVFLKHLKQLSKLSKHR